MFLSTYFLFCLNCFLYFSMVFGGNQECGLQNITCDENSKYRNIDGSCNNKKHPNWGTPFSTYNRFFPARYGDGVHSFPLTVDNEPLPNARNITAHIYGDCLKETCEKLTLNAMSFGQAIAHDLSFNKLPNLSKLACCSAYLTTLENPNKVCGNIEVLPDDPHYSFMDADCIPMLRTVTNRDLNCQENLTNEEPLSDVTSALDLSIIYGSTMEVHVTLRTYEGGLLITDTRDGHQWPPNGDRSVCPLLNKFETTCYHCGDKRATQNIQLTVTTVMWIREHNRLACKLAKLNPNWDDEQLFQTARAINIAQWQHIAYYELLPYYAGYNNLVENKVIYPIYYNNYINDYDENVKPNVYNEFAHGAYRVFHSMISGTLDLYGENGCKYGSLAMRDHLDRPVELEKPLVFDGLIRGFARQPSMAQDSCFDSDFTRHMFLYYLKVGEDSKSVDIQRSRDHGLPSYNQMREFCGLPKATKFEDFLDVMTEEKLDQIRQFYTNVDDVEFIVGIQAETNVKDTLAGPTALCVMYKQFRATRQADRFWYENESAGFTPAQLRQIRKANVARIMCDNGNDIKKMQPNAFKTPGIGNLPVFCAFIRGPNLRFWKEH